jgi:hypothetical protein
MNAVGKWLENNRSPGRKVKQIDNRYILTNLFCKKMLVKYSFREGCTVHCAVVLKGLKFSVVKHYGTALQIQERSRKWDKFTALLNTKKTSDTYRRMLF